MVSAAVTGNKCAWTITYTFRVKDECDNYTSNQTYTRSGGDKTAPTGTNPSPITGVNACLPTQLQADAAFDATLAAGGYSDACGGVVTAELVSAAVTGNKCAWTITFTFKVKDECNNYTANQTYTRSGGDKTAPTGTNPAAITGVDACLPTQVQADAAFNSTLAASGYSDACGGVVTAEMVSAVVSGNKCAWTITYTFRVKDECDNYTSNQTYTRSGGDKTAPTGTNPAPITGLNSCLPTQAQANSAFDATLAASGYSDACGGVVTASMVSAVVSGTKCGWTITYTFKVKDECNNYTANQTYTRNGSDQDAPTGTNPTAITGVDGCLPTPIQALAAFSPTLAAGGYTDNCGGAVTAEIVSTSITGTNCNWTVTYTFKVKDECNNYTANQTYTRSGSDQTNPVIAVCKTNAVKLFDSGETNYTVQGTEFDVSATDNCNLVSMAYALTGATPVAYNVANTSLAGVDLNGGVTTVTWTATDQCGNMATCVFTVTVNKRPTSIYYTGDGTEQYSDQQLLTAVLKDVTTNTVISGKTVKFTIGVQTVFDGPGAPGNGTDGSGIAEANLKLWQNPGGYTVVSCFEGDATYIGSTDSDPFAITKENALVSYTGPEIVGDPCTSCSTTNVLLSASVKDTVDGFPGDIRKARVKFCLVGGGDLSGWLTPGLVNPTDSTEGIVTFLWSAPLPASGFCTHDIVVKVDYGNYIGVDHAELTIYRLTLNEFITGGGHIIPSNSNGSYASTPGKKVNFGFNVKWNKSNKNLQGNMNIIFRRYGRVYQIKTNSLTSMSVNTTDPCSRKGSLVSKANLNDVTDATPVNLMGNLTLTATITDNGEPGSADKIGITVYNGNTLIYSSNWVSTQTVELLLNGGNIAVHNGVVCQNTRTAEPPVTASKTVVENVNTDQKKAPVRAFDVKAHPNPTEHQFTLYIDGGSMEKASIRVIDAMGRVVKQIETGGGLPIKFGADLKIGVYLVEVRQGVNRKVVRVIKQ